MAKAAKTLLHNTRSAESYGDLSYRSGSGVPNDSPIFDLCERGNLQGVMLAFAEGWANPHDTTPCGWTPLHAAIAFGHVRICELLLEYGVDGTNCVNYRDPFDILYGYTVNTCMQLRTDRPNSHTFTIFKALVKYGFDPVEPRGILGSTCFNGRWDPEIYTWLIDQEYVYIDFEQLNGDIFVEPPLMSLLGKSISSSAGQRLINRLLQVGVDVHAHRSSRTALDVAITENIVENWLQLLSHSGYDLRAYLLREQEIHGKEHVHKEFRCFPSLGGSLHHRSLVRYHYGATGDQCRISLVDYDAIDWFFAGFFDLDIFSDSNTVTCNACDESFDSNGVRHYFCAEFDRVGDMAIVCFECMNSPIWSIIYYPDVGNQFVLVDHTRQTEETHEGVSNTATGEQSRDIFRVSRTLVEALRLESTAAALASSVNLRWIYGLSVLFLIWHFSLKLVLFAIAAAYTVQLGLIWKGLKTGLTMEHEPKGGSRKTRRQRRRANRRKSRGTP
ncbi:MAG: hypothetical protein M1836_001314 [Candelina mexicana]|nr:MAG: hypothetical protein M1836_001314 [Candelina mexicana]